MTSPLPIVERFHSLQGEGMHVGKSAFFIRIAGCTVGCPWCDTKESWPIDKHPTLNVHELAQETKLAQSQGASIVIITGGEPLHHNLNNLCDAIKDATTTQNSKSLPIHLETSGVNDISGSIDWITLSPKRHLLPVKSLLQACHELKVVIQEKEDLYFAEEMAQQSIYEKKSAASVSCLQNKKSLEPYLFLQPEWASKYGQELSIEYIKAHPKWRLSLQTHKWLGVR